jgi:hypothetical protein
MLAVANTALAFRLSKLPFTSLSVLLFAGLAIDFNVASHFSPQ